MFPRIIREFVAHWRLLDARLPTDQPLVVLQNLPVSTLQTLGERLAAAEWEIQEGMMASRAAWEEAQMQKKELRIMSRDFNVWMRGVYSRRLEAQLLPAVVGQGEAAEKVRLMALRTQWVWRRVAALPPAPHARPPVLVTGQTLADYEEALALYDGLLDSLIDVELDEALALAAAVLLREEIVSVATAYGHAVKGRLPAGDPLRAPLPALWHPGGRGAKRARLAGETGK